MKRRLSVRNAVATECIRTVLDILAMGEFKGICVEIADIIFHRGNLESSANSPFFCEGSDLGFSFGVLIMLLDGLYNDFGKLFKFVYLNK